MDLVLIRHGEGEHALDIPRSLELADPRLTDTGRAQVVELGRTLRTHSGDLFVVSPTRRTLETALILRGDTAARLVVTPEVGPRMFRVDRGWNPLPCDELLPLTVIEADFPGLEVRRTDLWPAGINTMPAELFAPLGRGLLEWCRHQNPRRALLVAHDGTVHNYSKLLRAGDPTTETRLGPAGHIQLVI